MDLRRYARGTQRRLILGGLAILFGAGTVLIYLSYGPQAAAFGLLCLLLGLVPVLLILVALWILDVVLHRSREP